MKLHDATCSDMLLTLNFKPAGVQRAVVFNMPLAVAVAQSYAHYLAIPKKYKTMILGTEDCKISWGCV